MNRNRVQRIRPRMCLEHMLTVLALAVTVPTAAEATVRKCTAPVGGPLLMVNGVIIGDLPESGDWWYPTPAGNRKVISAEVIETKMICIEQEVDGRRVTRTVISVATGGEDMLRHYLGELAGLQEDYRQKYGSYASTLPFLAFYRGRPPLPIELNAADGGWSASTMWAGKSCRVAVGTAVPPGSIAGEVECFAATDASSPSAAGETPAARGS